MQVLARITIALLAASFAHKGWAKSGAKRYTDSATDIKIPLIEPELGAGEGLFEFGMVLPESALTTDTYDYIGFLRCATTNGSAWCGVSHGVEGQMVNALLLMAWPYKKEVLTSFRFAEDYVFPSVYTGPATLTTLSSRVSPADATFEIAYHCQNCLQWNQNGLVGNVSTSAGGGALGRAAAKMGPSNAGCPNDIGFGFHDNGYGQFRVDFANVTSKHFDKWAKLPPKSGGAQVTGNCTAGSPGEAGAGYPST